MENNIREILGDKLIELCPAVRENVLLSEHTTFKVGGPCDYFAEPEDVYQLKNIITLCKEYSYPFFVIGRGSNILVSDEGYRGVIIKLGKSFGFVSYDAEKDTISSGCGATLASLAAVACENGIAGFEFASGIPGSVGGAIRMNAGAYGGEIAQIITGCTYLKNGEVYNVSVDELELSYRHSIFSCDSECIILSAEFKGIAKDDSTNIRSRMNELNLRRKEKQPLEYASAGSTFKRPAGMFAGKLIEDSDLKGYSVGGASVSEKHAGFVVNKGGASCSDIVSVMDHVRAVVNSKFGVVLEPEVILLGKVTLKEVF